MIGAIAWRCDVFERWYPGLPTMVETVPLKPLPREHPEILMLSRFGSEATIQADTPLRTSRLAGTAGGGYTPGSAGV